MTPSPPPPLFSSILLVAFLLFYSHLQPPPLSGDTKPTINALSPSRPTENTPLLTIFGSSVKTVKPLIRSLLFTTTDRKTPTRYRLLFFLLLTLAGDVELNPGPTTPTAETFPCGLCDRPVTWSMLGAVCCDNCSMWIHKSCTELNSKEYSIISKPNVTWLCHKCDSLNVDSFTFHSFTLQDSFYSPIQDENITLDSFTDNQVSLSPLKASTPNSDRQSTAESPKLAQNQTNSPRPRTSSTEHINKSKNKHNLRVLTINLQGTIGKRANFHAELDYTKPDIVCCQETKLRGKKPGKNYTSDAYLDSEFVPDNYLAFRNDRNAAGGGVMILVRKNLVVVEEPNFVTDCEIAWVKLKLLGCKELWICCFYMPHRNMKDLTELDASLQKLTQDGNKDKQIMILGDFNCPHINWQTLEVPAGADQRQVQEFLIDISIAYGLTQLVNEPTRLENTLDLCFTTNATLVKNTQVIPGLSDHHAVIVDSITKPKYQQFAKKTIFIYSKANWANLKTKCSEISNKIIDMTKDQGNTCIQTVYNFFETSLQNAVNEEIPQKTITNRHSLPWLNKKLKKMSNKKRRLRKQAKRTKTWDNYNFFQKECRREHRKAEQNFVKNSIEQGLLENNTKPFWRYVKSRRQDNIGISPLLDTSGIPHSDSKGKAQILLKQFCSVFTENLNSNQTHQTNRHIDDALVTIKVTNDGVEKLLKKINPSKAQGPDNIQNRVLQECAKELTPAVATLFNLSLSTSTLPTAWTQANISPIFKKGNRHHAENYRPVSLTSVLSKTLEHIVYSNILQHLDKHNILTKLNHGFRRGFSCETQLALTLDDIVRNFDKNIQTDIIVLDFSKAFDKVPHERLLLKLNSYGIRGELLKWITNYLCNRTMKVIVDGASSDAAPVLSGVPQGTVLGPLLFLCFINDLPDAVSSQVRLFADDCVLYRQIKKYPDHLKLQEDLLNLETWASKWGMEFNAKKCHVMSVKNKTSFFYQLCGEILKNVDNTTYLGLNISNDLKWATHIKEICSKASSKLGFIRRNLQHCPLTTRKNAYLALVRSSLEYGAAIWDPHYKIDIDRVEKIQSRAIRFIKRDYHSRDHGCVERMRHDLQLESLQDRRRNIRLSLFYKVVHGLTPAIQIKDHLTPVNNNKRQIKAKQFNDFISNNPVDKYNQNNNRCFKIPQAKVEYEHSFFIRTAKEWNSLNQETVDAASINAFRAKLRRD